MRLHLFTIACSLAALSASPVAGAQGANIVFHTVDVFGNSLPYKVDQFASTTVKGDRSSMFTGLRATGLPFGKYSYRLVRTDFPSHAALVGEVTVDHEDTFCTVAYYGNLFVVEGQVVEPLMTHPRPTVFRGAIRGDGSEIDRFPRSGSSQHMNPVASKPASMIPGNFETVGEFRGIYILSIFGERGSLSMRGIISKGFTESPPPVVIDLSASPEVLDHPIAVVWPESDSCRWAVRRTEPPGARRQTGKSDHVVHL